MTSRYTTDEYEDVIALLLAIIDRYEPGMRRYGNTPDWYLIAAQMSWGVEVPNIVEKLAKDSDEYFGPNKE
jgi:hypothetical protein